MSENNKVIINLHMVDQGLRKSAVVGANTLILDTKLQKTWFLVKFYFFPPKNWGGGGEVWEW